MALDRSSLRFIIAMVIACAIGVVIGQLSMSLSTTMPIATEKVKLVEGTLATGGGLSRLDQLAALPYISSERRAGDKNSGVNLHDEQSAFKGLNFYSSRDRTMAHLINNHGREIRRWAHATGRDGWQHVELLASGDVLAMVKNDGVYKLGADSELIWKYDTLSHHDLWVTADGEIYVLGRRQRDLPEIIPDIPVMDDTIEVLSADGKKLSELSVLDAFRRSTFDFLLPSPVGLPMNPSMPYEELRLDVLHTNHVEVFDGSQDWRSPLFKKGNMLVSMRTINTVAIIDGETSTVVWAWGPVNLTRQHHPSLLESGNILIFDNGLTRSQIVELDPLNLRVAWRYAPERGFFTDIRGSVQRLANGNTLITESQKGRVFEITPDGEIVWSFLNPDVKENGVRVPIWRMTRYALDELPFL